ncbi:NAD(P)-dependent oxidoreductase [Streptomyces uncialis]|uniref:Epimerase n=1 Tax=Streptomyces uncialis TaxID=1048205 RepID=A0A1Q4V2F5_9ACTN|nr:NAD(P)H-binding protein [Streptomyces uncialis]OKH91919.1 epimerase [Streptomyces uncialis]WTE11405.1 NAD(P)H-binding protein [Streptomyces uncialis]
MRITVFGATGGVGRELVGQGLAAGHEVTAVVRDPARLTVTGDALRVVRADLTVPGEVRSAVAGQDAVLSALGPRTRKDAGITAPLTAAVLAAMADEGVRRLLVVSATPLGTPPPGEPRLDRMMKAVVDRVFKANYDDLREMEKALAASGADWTAVRPPRLLDGPVTGAYRRAVGGNPPSARAIRRADVAHAMLAAITDPETVRRPVGIAD